MMNRDDPVRELIHFAGCFQELNTSNYTDDEVCELNAWGVLIANLAKSAEAALLSAKQAQEPVAEVVSYHTAGLYDELPIGTKLYTAPPSTAQIEREARERALEDLVAMMAVRATPEELADYCLAELEKVRSLKHQEPAACPHNDLISDGTRSDRRLCGETVEPAAQSPTCPCFTISEDPDKHATSCPEYKPALPAQDEISAALDYSDKIERDREDAERYRHMRSSFARGNKHDLRWYLPAMTPLTADGLDAALDAARQQEKKS